MIRTPKIEDRKSFGEITHKVLLSLVGYDQQPLSFPDKQGYIALSLRDRALQITSSYSENLRSDYILPFDQIESILLDGTPRIVRKKKYNKVPSMLLGTLILGFLGLLADDDHVVIPMLMATLGLILGAVIPIESSKTELFWQINIRYKSANQSFSFSLEGKNEELKTLCSILKDHSLRKVVQDELNLIEVLSPQRAFGD